MRRKQATEGGSYLGGSGDQPDSTWAKGLEEQGSGADKETDHLTAGRHGGEQMLSAVCVWYAGCRAVLAHRTHPLDGLQCCGEK